MTTKFEIISDDPSGWFIEDEIITDRDRNVIILRWINQELESVKINGKMVHYAAPYGGEQG